MSRSNPRLKNPCTRWFDWDGEKGLVKYYDKEAEENVEIPLPFTFLALDEMAKVTGWDEPRNEKIFSNEVRNTGQEALSVKADGKEIARGMYGDIKGTVEDRGGNYTASLYLAYKGEDDELKIGNLALKRSSLRAWLEFKEIHGHEVFQKAVVIRDFEESSFENEEEETVTYRVPAFDLRDVKKDSARQAHELDVKLQEYLEGRPSYNGQPPAAEDQAPTEESSQDNDQQDVPDDIDDDLPF